MNDYEIQKIRDTAFCSGYNTAVSKYEKQNKELQEENAELKKKYVKNITDCDICDTYCNSQLTKAKEIIRDFLSVAIDYIDKEDKNYSLIEEAEQFLNSEVEK